MARSRPNKLPATAASDPHGPRLLPIKTENPAPSASGLTGYSWVSLADTAMKIWEGPTDKNGKCEPARRRA